MFSKYFTSLSSRVVTGLVLVAIFAFGGPRPAQAQFAVIDVASIAQLIQQYMTLEQQLTTLKNQLSQAQSEYAAITGNRGMQNLLSGTQRNYLPGTWSQLSSAMSGFSGSYPALASSIASLMKSNAILTPAQVASLSASEQAQLTAARQNPALLQAASRTALANSSDRFASLQQLIGAIGTAADQKASLDLTARIAAEQGMLQNESTKLQVLHQVVQGQEWARIQQVRELAIADQGSLRSLPALGL
jgi:type IV secretion system protein VirB5